MSTIRLLAGLTLCLLAAWVHGDEEAKAYPNPARYEKAIADFEALDEQEMPQAGGIVCMGSSSMRGWHWQIANDLSPLSVIARGFGGSNMYDALHFADRIIMAYKPRAVVIYEGDNDIAIGITPEKVAETFAALVKAIHDQLPETRIYILSIKPSPVRWHIWPQMQATNALFAKMCDDDKRLIYLDIATPMLGEDGEPKPELYKEDRLHMTRAGYEVWRDAVRPILLANELAHEPDQP